MLGKSIKSGLATLCALFVVMSLLVAEAIFRASRLCT